VARPERGMVHLPTARFLASLGMTVQPADADQAHEQRRPDDARAGEVEWGVEDNGHAE
jgi:hypothetical protein